MNEVYHDEAAIFNKIMRRSRPEGGVKVTKIESPPPSSRYGKKPESL